MDVPPSCPGQQVTTVTAKQLLELSELTQCEVLTDQMDQPVVINQINELIMPDDYLVCVVDDV